MICPACKGKKTLPICTVCHFAIEHGDCMCVDEGKAPSPGEEGECPECCGEGSVEDDLEDDDRDEDFEEEEEEEEEGEEEEEEEEDDWDDESFNGDDD